MNQTKLVLCNWRVEPFCAVSVGVGVREFVESESLSIRSGVEIREIHRVFLESGSGSLEHMVKRTRVQAETWIKNYYEAQKLQDRLNRELEEADPEAYESRD